MIGTIILSPMFQINNYMTLSPSDDISRVTFNSTRNSLAVSLEDLHEEGVDRLNTSRYIGVYFAHEKRDESKRIYDYIGAKPCTDVMSLNEKDFGDLREIAGISDV